MKNCDHSRLAQLRPIHCVYIFTLLVCGLATFGTGGIILATPICLFWGFVFTSRSRPRTFANICLLILLAVGLLSSLSQAMGYSPRSAVRRMMCSNNLKLIALALHEYHDTYGCFPPAYIADSNGRPMHSWRVLLLPFLEQDNLYKQYALDEPWNGPNNRKLLNRMPQVYACPSANVQDQPTYNTSYVAVVGPTTAWPGPLPRSYAEIQDGTSNTALVIEVDKLSIPWLEPGDLPLDDTLATLAAGDADFIGNHRWQSFLYDYAGGRQVALADGSVRYVSQGVGRRVWAALLGAEDGDPWGDEDLTVPEVVHRRLQVTNCVRLTLFVLLTLFPLPWVWLNPTSRHGSAQLNAFDP
jgi:hypothetical protein